VVIAIDAHGVRIGPRVQIAADFAQKLPVGVKLEQLRGGGPVGRSAGVATRQYEDMALGIDGDAGHRAEIHVGREVQKVRHGVERDLRGLGLSAYHGARQQQRHTECHPDRFHLNPLPAGSPARSIIRRRSTMGQHGAAGGVSGMYHGYTGLWGILVLIADVWAIVNIFQSGASTERKVLWTVLVIVLPVLGFIIWLLAGPRTGRS